MFQLLEVAVRGRVIGSVSLFRDELMVSTDENKIWRYRWDGSINNDFCIDLRRIPFSLDQQASRAIPLQVCCRNTLINIYDSFSGLITFPW